jgi:glycine dehydrogenase subunit 1
MSLPDVRHPYLPNVDKLEAAMLKTLGIKKIDELFDDIPSKFLLKKALQLPEGLSEIRVIQRIERLLAKNWDPITGLQFLGGGAWPHLIPEALRAVIARTEFVTAYTPYQAEISQGMLQALFEYQSLIAELVELPVVNASMYDWASALGEAALMSGRVTKRQDFLVPKFMSPERRLVLETYTAPADIRIIPVECNLDQGCLEVEDLKQKISKNCAGVYIENPAYLGYLESQVDAIAEITHDAGGLFVTGIDPTSLGVLRSPGDYNADIVVGEGQPLGSPVNTGGPLLGIFACCDDRRLIRQLPGRIIGMTTTIDGEARGFVMTMQAREQHIRREKATSNICSNQALLAVTAAIYLSLMGPSGLQQLGATIIQLRQYTEKQLSKITGIKAPRFNASHFKEFVFTLEPREKQMSIQRFLKILQKEGVLAGIPLDTHFPQLGESALMCVTEIQTKDEIDRLIAVIQHILEGDRH